MLKVSVIIPVYNVEKYLEKCLETVINQSLKELEVILVNDGSTDSSEDIIDEYICNYPNIFKKFNKQNGGQGSARNIGIENASRRIYNFY